MGPKRESANYSATDHLNPNRSERRFRPYESSPKRFLEGHARANRQKPSTVVTKESILRVHLIPLLGAKRLDAITNEDVQRLKGCASEEGP